MIGCVVVTHGNLGKALAECAETILGPQEKLFTLAVTDLTMQDENLRERLMEVVDEADQGEGVLVYTDLFGGTPANLAISMLGVRSVEVLVGVSLPMLLKGLLLRTQSPHISLQEISRLAEEAGKKQIALISDFMRQEIGGPVP